MSSARVKEPGYLQGLPDVRCEANSVVEGRAGGFDGIEIWPTSFAFSESNAGVLQDEEGTWRA